MNYYFFLQSLFKKKIKNIYLYLSISNIFLFPSILYTHSMQNTLPYKSQTIPSSVQSADTNHKQILDAIVQQLPLLELQRIGAHDPTKVSNESFNAKQNRNERKERSKRRAQQLNPLGKLVSM